MASPVIKVVDKASGTIKGIAGKLGKIARKAMIPVGVAAAAGTIALGGSVSAGMQLEQQQISIEHLLGQPIKRCRRMMSKPSPSPILNSCGAMPMQRHLKPEK